jgi:hypothetical protein
MNSMDSEKKVVAEMQFFVLRMMSERCIEMQRDLYVCLMDYKKAVDNVRYGGLIV